MMVIAKRKNRIFQSPLGNAERAFIPLPWKYFFRNSRTKPNMTCYFKTSRVIPLRNDYDANSLTAKKNFGNFNKDVGTLNSKQKIRIRYLHCKPDR